MARLRQGLPPKSVWLVLCLVMSISQGCARPGVFHRSVADANSASDEQKLPFHQNSDHAADDTARPAVPLDQKAGNTAPFPTMSHSIVIPAGTLITVQLENLLSIAHVRGGDAFTASVAGPLTVDGDTLVEHGAPVSGRVESAQPSSIRPGLTPDPGYVRLILNAITVDGRVFPLQTSSLFVKGSLQASVSPVLATTGAQPTDFQVLKGRRLTFRLTAPVIFTGENSVINRQYSDASK